MCGIFGIANHADAARITYAGLYALQHRGQESAGISSTDGQETYTHKDMGYVSDIFKEEVLESLKGSRALGQTRYSTAGESAKRNAQPIVSQTARGIIALVHNGNLTNSHELRDELEFEGAIFQSSSDSEVILHLIARSTASTLVEALHDALGRVQGAYSLLIMTENMLIAARDPSGFRPLVMGVVNGSFVFASETCAFDLIGAADAREICPGEIVWINAKGELVEESTRIAYLPRTQKCIFEQIYFARPDSVVFGRTVKTSRNSMGKFLAREAPVPADLVVPVPDSGVPAAVGYAAESKIPLDFGLIRNHYVGRTFIEPTLKMRDFNVRVKLNPVREVLEGKRIILVDDSIVRGNTSQKIVKMVRDAGATEVHVRISCPPTVSPCFYGIDTPTKSELLAANKSVEEICAHIGADSLAYLSMGGLLSAVNSGFEEFCLRCFQL